MNWKRSRWRDVKNVIKIHEKRSYTSTSYKYISNRDWNYKPIPLAHFPINLSQWALLFKIIWPFDFPLFLPYCQSPVCKFLRWSHDPRLRYEGGLEQPPPPPPRLLSLQNSLGWTRLMFWSCFVKSSKKTSVYIVTNLYDEYIDISFVFIFVLWCIKTIMLLYSVLGYNARVIVAVADSVLSTSVYSLHVLFYPLFLMLLSSPCFAESAVSLSLRLSLLIRWVCNSLRACHSNLACVPRWLTAVTGRTMASM